MRGSSVRVYKENMEQFTILSRKLISILQPSTVELAAHVVQMLSADPPSLTPWELSHSYICRGRHPNVVCAQVAV